MAETAVELLGLSGITRRFGALVAVDDVSLSVRAGEVHALVGENGAGKSTLMNMAYGILAPDAGTLRIDGAEERLAGPADALRLGVGMVHQHFKLAPSFTVAENIILGAEPPLRLGRLDRAEAARRTTELGRRFGLELDPHARVADLPVGLQQRVEILKALHRKVRVLILDEPTAVLTPQETRELFATMGTLAQAGAAIVFITHKLREVLAVSHRISVMRHGRVVATRQADEVTAEALARLMVGRPVLLRVVKGWAHPQPVPLLRLERLTVRGDRGEMAVRGMDLDVHPGEIVGLAGVQGNGQDELVQAITGFRRPAAGRVEIGGIDVTGALPAAVRRAGLAYVPADRGRVGLSLASRIWENMALGHHRSPPLARGMRIDTRAARRRARALIERFDVRGASTETPARALSGGNQQKVVLARELSREARLIVVEQPSQGVDIGAIEAIHRLLVRMRDAGCAVLLVSADLDEILSLSDSIVVMYRGAVAGSCRAEQADARMLGRLMGGLDAAGGRDVA